MNMGIYIYIYIFSPLWTSPTPLLILKSPRSGSTWFSSLLNGFEDVYITPEIVSWQRRKTARVFETNGKITSYIIKSLRHPMLQWPQGENLVQSVKSKLVVGATFNPRTTYVSLDRIGAEVSNLRVVAFLRSNVVKHAISYIRGFELESKCGKHQQEGSCRLEGKTTIHIKEFHNLLIHVITDDLYIVKMAQVLAGHVTNWFRVIFYEDLLGVKDELENFMKWLGFEMKYPGVKERFVGRCFINCTKITSDDLREVIANYEEIESWIKSEYPCLSTQFYEHRPSKVQSPLSILCGNLFANESHIFHPYRSHNFYKKKH